MLWWSLNMRNYLVKCSVSFDCSQDYNPTHFVIFYSLTSVEYFDSQLLERDSSPNAFKYLLVEIYYHKF